MNQHRFLRLLKLLKLMQGKTRTIRSIERYLNISNRSVYRYFDCFKQAGYEVIKKDYNRFYIKEN